MKFRTKESIFKPCPICGKKPYVSYYPPHLGLARCKGSVFNPHDRIEAYVVWENPSNLVEKLAQNWNQVELLKY